MGKITNTLPVNKCRGCPFVDIADSLDRVCTFRPNFSVAPRRRCLRQSDIYPNIKKADDSITAVLVDWFFDYDKKPKWCRLKETSITYE